MKSKKILITVIALCVALVGVITALVVVLVNSNQSAKSNVTVTYIAEDVACTVSASYAKIDMPAENTVTFSFTNMTGDNGNTLTIDGSTASGSLNPSGDITLDKQYSRIVFRYTFTNTMSNTPMYVELTGMPDNDTEGESLDNIGLLYYNDYVGNPYMIGLFSGVYDNEFTNSMGKLVVPALCTKYVYLIVSVNDLYANASFTGEIEWTLTRGEKPITTDVTAGSSLSLSNLYVGCEVTEADLNHSTVNIRTLDWYTDSSLSTKATFPVTTTESTTLYSSYLKGNIAEENLTYQSYRGGFGVDREALVTDATSTVAGYTPITSTDTTLVIPDMFELSDGRVVPIVYHAGAYYGGDEIDLLNSNTTVTTVYYGNNVWCIDGLTTTGSVSVLTTVYFGLDFEYIGDGYVTVNTTLTHIYFTEGTTSFWVKFDGTGSEVAYYSGTLSEEILSDPQQAVSELKNSRNMINCGWRRFGYSVSY